ncbi:hypothetical protein ACFSCW_09075 [Sphingomonas tabacisoli]|uniref:Flippase-like domain-containing protein n=1 Tax=Sphingomonas tabacisoli TaxID=2249466 RepID=A0ABW4I330_9SPHN
MYLSDLNIAGRDGGAALAPPPQAPVLPDPNVIARSVAARPAVWAGRAITFGLLIAVLWQLRTLDARQVIADIPSRPAFWIVFALWYATAPVADWVIFRRLWRIPADGLIALTRKFVGNELVLGYIGEAYFYTWARARAGLTSAPFGAIKDVAILSALVGNVVTLLMLAAAYPALGTLHLGLSGPTFAVSIAAVLVSSLGMMVFRRRLFGLSNGDLWFVAAVHFVRLALKTYLSALMWHFVLPGQPLELWVLLSALRLLLSRLPLLPNKDLVFAGLSVLLMGHDVEIATLMAMIASLTVAAHVAVGAAVLGADMVRWTRK